MQCLLDESDRLDVCARAPNGEDAAIMATKSGFTDLASKLSRLAYLELRRQSTYSLLADDLPGLLAQ